MGSYHITVLKGDGIGPDVVTEAMGVLECIGRKYGHDFIFNEFGKIPLIETISHTALSDEQKYQEIAKDYKESPEMMIKERIGLQYIRNWDSSFIIN